MSPVHRIGRMSEPSPEYTPVVVHVRSDLLEALDRHIINRVHEDGPQPQLSRMPVERDAIFALAVQAHIDFWPEHPPAGAYANRHAGLAERAERSRAAEGRTS